MRWLLRAGMRHGWRKGILGGSSTWVVVGGAAVIGHLARKALVRSEDVIWSGELAPGHVLTVHHEPEG